MQTCGLYYGSTKYQYVLNVCMAYLVENRFGRCRSYHGSAELSPLSFELHVNVMQSQ